MDEQDKKRPMKCFLSHKLNFEKKDSFIFTVPYGIINENTDKKLYLFEPGSIVLIIDITQKKIAVENEITHEKEIIVKREATVKKNVSDGFNILINFIKQTIKLEEEEKIQRLFRNWNNKWIAKEINNNSFGFIKKLNFDSSYEDCKDKEVVDYFVKIFKIMLYFNDVNREDGVGDYSIDILFQDGPNPEKGCVKSFNSIGINKELSYLITPYGFVKIESLQWASNEVTNGIKNKLGIQNFRETKFGNLGFILKGLNKNELFEESKFEKIKKKKIMGNWINLREIILHKMIQDIQNSKQNQKN